MREHDHGRFFGSIREKGLRGVLIAAVSFAICPGDDILMITGSILSNKPSVENQQGTMPTDDNFKIRGSRDGDEKVIV